MTSEQVWIMVGNRSYVFIDLRKAFDTMHHSFLLKILAVHGIDGSELLRFEDYIFNKTLAFSAGISNSTEYLCIRLGLAVSEKARKKVEEMPAINQHKSLHCAYTRAAHANSCCMGERKARLK